MRVRFFGGNDKALRLGLAGGLVLSLVFLGLSLFLPGALSARYYQKSLGLLRRQAQTIRKEFSGILRDEGLKLRRAAAQDWPETTELRFGLFKNLRLDPETEGVAAYTEDGKLTLWLGNVLNLEEAVPGGISNVAIQQFGQTLLINDKASSYLVSLHWVNEQTLLVLYRLLAFIPQFKSPYLQDYQVLNPGLRENWDIDYYDFREDVSGFERIFSQHKDEYIGQPNLQREILSLVFPLRNERSQILAKVSLRSPSVAAFRMAWKETLLIAFYILSAFSLLLFLFFLCRRPSIRRERKVWPGLAALSVLIGLRLAFFALGRLGTVQSLPFFSPALAAFPSLGNLTQSPGDIMFTSLAVSAVLAGLAFYIRKPGLERKNPQSPASSAVVLAIVFAFSAALLLGAQTLCARLAQNSSLNLLKFNLTGTFLLLHVSMALFIAACALFITALLKSAAETIGRARRAWLVFFVTQAALYLGFGRSRPALFLLEAAALGSLAALVLFTKRAFRTGVIWAALLLQVLFVYGTLMDVTSAKSRMLQEKFLKNTILSHENWALFIMDQSFGEIEKRQNILLAYLRHPAAAADPSRELWESTLAAKFNWYSSLEILGPGGRLLSRFSLNVPKIFRAEAGLPGRPEWTISRLSIPFMGKEKDFLVGSRSWTDKGAEIGRTVFYLSLDYDLLPFLYSANPYFELLRVNSLPSLNQYDFRLAVFDSNGGILFNPSRISTGLAPSMWQSSELDGPGLWTSFRDKGNSFRLYAFMFQKRIYALFSPQGGLVPDSIAYFRLLVLYAAILVLPSLFLYVVGVRRNARHPLWSFANRVYISFIAVALVPLLLFTVFSRALFNRVFTQQFVERAQMQAGTARSVMDDFIYLQQQDRAEIRTPPEDLVLWISTTISNDVNLYQDGRLVSSSRREFFDAGLFPDLVDGEIYYKIQFENNPFYTQTRHIGNFSFQTLSVPYTPPEGPRLIISLPFPFEQQEISNATQELVEFFLLITVFFVITVLLLARGIGSMIVTPIRKLLAGTREASLGNLDFTIEHRTHDEMKTLVDGFNAMIKSLKDHQQELADLGKKAAWAEMARKVAHEIKNPLTPIQLSAEHLLRVYEDRRADFDTALKESISYITSEVENLRRIAQEFLEISKEAVLHKESFAFDALIRETVEPYQRLLAERIQIRESIEDGDFRFDGDPAKLKIALRNLLTNAIESIRGRGEIRVGLARRKGFLVVTIEDTGVGIERDVLGRIFEPYFSTKDVGTGLGLPIAKKIIEDHRGTIEIASEPKKGTKITIRFAP